MNEVFDRAHHGAAEHIQFHASDQLSIAQLPALELIQAGHESGQNAMFLQDFFIRGALSTHFGKPDTSLHDPIREYTFGFY